MRKERYNQRLGVKLSFSRDSPFLCWKITLLLYGTESARSWFGLQWELDVSCSPHSEGVCVSSSLQPEPGMITELPLPQSHKGCFSLYETMNNFACMLAL